MIIGTMEAHRKAVTEVKSLCWCERFEYSVGNIDKMEVHIQCTRDIITLPIV